MTTLENLAKAVIEYYGDKKTRIEVTGLREGEKMHEKLFSTSESNVVSDLKIECSEYGEMLTIEEIKDWLGCPQF